MSNPRSPVQPLDDSALSQVSGGAFTNYSDSVRGGGGSETFHAGDGNDSVAGGSGQDTINGDAGNDLLMGNSGNDVLNGGAGSDLLIGGAGADRVNGGDGNDVARWQPGEGNDTIDGGTGTDQLILEGVNMTPQQLLAAITVTGGAQPSIQGSSVNLTGVSGYITINGERITFANLESVVSGSYQYFSGR